MGDRIEIESISSAHRTTRANRATYEAMRDALLRVLPRSPPGLKVSQAKAPVLPHLPDAPFPAGRTAGGWLKAVQLDLEAKGVIARAPRKPVQLYRTA